MSNDEKIAHHLTELVKLLNENGDTSPLFYGIEYGNDQFATVGKSFNGAFVIIAHPVCKDSDYFQRNIIALDEAREFAVDNFAYQRNVTPPRS